MPDLKLTHYMPPLSVLEQNVTSFAKPTSQRFFDLMAFLSKRGVCIHGRLTSMFTLVCTIFVNDIWFLL